MKTHTRTITIAILSLCGVCFSQAGEVDEPAACCAVEKDEPAVCCSIEPVAQPHQHGEMQPAGTPTSHSLFNVESTWVNQSGKRGPLSQLGGRSQVIAMVYTTCKFACPRILADLKTIQAGLPSASSADLGFCLITIDPVRDTVASFKTYSQKNNLDNDTWTFLRGEPGDILELANLLGVKYKKMPDGEFSHSNIITLLKPNGEISFQLNGLGADPTELIKAAKHQLHGH